MQTSHESKLIIHIDLTKEAFAKFVELGEFEQLERIAKDEGIDLLTFKNPDGTSLLERASEGSKPKVKQWLMNLITAKLQSTLQQYPDSWEKIRAPWRESGWTGWTTRYSYELSFAMASAIDPNVRIEYPRRLESLVMTLKAWIAPENQYAKLFKEVIRNKIKDLTPPKEYIHQPYDTARVSSFSSGLFTRQADPRAQCWYDASFPSVQLSDGMIAAVEYCKDTSKTNILIIDPYAGKCIKQFSGGVCKGLPYSSAAVPHITELPNGSIAMGMGNTLRIFDQRTGKQIQESILIIEKKYYKPPFNKAAVHINQLLALPDGNVLINQHDHRHHELTTFKEILIYDVKTSKIREFKTSSSVMCFIPESKDICVFDYNKIQFYDMTGRSGASFSPEINREEVRYLRLAALQNGNIVLGYEEHDYSYIEMFSKAGKCLGKFKLPSYEGDIRYIVPLKDGYFATKSDSSWNHTIRIFDRKCKPVTTIDSYPPHLSPCGVQFICNQWLIANVHESKAAPEDHKAHSGKKKKKKKSKQKARPAPSNRHDDWDDLGQSYSP